MDNKFIRLYLVSSAWCQTLMGQLRKERLYEHEAEDWGHHLPITGCSYIFYLLYLPNLFFSLYEFDELGWYWSNVFCWIGKL